MTNLINKNKLNEGMHEFAKDKLNNLEKELDREFKWIIGCINNGGEVERYKNTAMVHISSNYKLKTLGIIREVISPYINYDFYKALVEKMVEEKIQEIQKYNPKEEKQLEKK